MDVFKGFDRNFKVLVADDQPQNLELIKDILQSSHCQVITASNGKDAFEKALVHEPDLVLLDVMMPEMDGYEGCYRLETTEKTQLVAVVIITALSALEST